MGVMTQILRPWGGKTADNAKNREKSGLNRKKRGKKG